MRLWFGLRVCICVAVVLVESSSLVEGSTSTSINGFLVIILNTKGVSVLFDSIDVLILKLSLDTCSTDTKSYLLHSDLIKLNYSVNLSLLINRFLMSNPHIFIFTYFSCRKFIPSCCDGINLFISLKVIHNLVSKILWLLVLYQLIY